jgi:hypothetical protein
MSIPRIHPAFLVLLLAILCPLAHAQDDPGSTPTPDSGDEAGDVVDVNVPPADRFLRRAYGKGKDACPNPYTETHGGSD